MGRLRRTAMKGGGLAKTHFNRLIVGAKVVDNLTPIGVIPQSEAQTRPPYFP